MSASSWPWVVLDLPHAPETTAEVRRAYARKLKTIDQAKDIAGFEALRKAYEAALARVEQTSRASTLRAVPPAPPAPTPTVRLDRPSPSAPAPPPQLPPAPIVTLPDPLAEVAPSTPPPVITLPDPPAETIGHDPAPVVTLPDPAPIPPARPEPRGPSLDEELQSRFAELTGQANILLSPAVIVRQILEDPRFQVPELDPLVRKGMAKFLRDALVTSETQGPYFPRSSVSPEIMKTLDARFGWLSDFKAFGRDLGGNMRLLEAMIDAAGVKRERQRAPNGPARKFATSLLSGRKSALIVGSSLLLLAKMNVAQNSEGAPAGSAIVWLAALLNLVFEVMLLVATVLVLRLVFRLTAKHFSRVIAFLATAYLGFVYVSFLLSRLITYLD